MKSFRQRKEDVKQNNLSNQKQMSTTASSSSSLETEAEAEAETVYHSKDFKWETLKEEIENNPSYHYHLQPFHSPQHQHHQQDSKAWQNFHTRHSSGKFFKERRYLLKEFPELVNCGEGSKVLEVGCGNGSTVLPILRGNRNVIVYACDCSCEILERAKEFVGASDLASVQQRFHPFYCDFSATGFPKWLACDSCRSFVPQKQHGCFSDVDENDRTHSNDLDLLKKSDCCLGGVDFVTMIFTLSAVSSRRMPSAISECFFVLKPGGLLLFRDYGLYDMSMLRFEPGQRVGSREYMRSDGTRSYFFCLETVRNIVAGAGFVELELYYCCINLVNRRNGKSMRRVWIHGKFQKPI
ncbi:Methyltransf_23 domain-containing protein [Cephalotus follicularis]|uniref:tRNA N(3)-methylcytidine methyltransferase n=1 Tax=Cephalotus follicularis TaxID=3775 RepID=A0A1Q3BFL1_CEPFO|nr:Methyltransf_23 domain-containing protein [Cephalotus follicularis]